MRKCDLGTRWDALLKPTRSSRAQGTPRRGTGTRTHITIQFGIAIPVGIMQKISIMIQIANLMIIAMR